MSKQGVIKQDGVVTEALGNAKFRVKLENEHEILATISGRCACTTYAYCRATG